MVITEEMAEKYFGDADPIGKVISVDNNLDFKVTGVLSHIPRNSHFKFNFLASMASFEELASGYFKGLGAWFNNGFYKARQHICSGPHCIRHGANSAARLFGG